MVKIEDIAIEVKLKQNFSAIKETLSRIGITNSKTKTLYPSCYILHKRGKYYVIHFKNLFGLDGKILGATEEDKIRQSSIAMLLEKWGLVEILDKTNIKQNSTYVYVLPFEEKCDWTIEHKYNIGSSKK